jgi:hypothetical protein
MFGLILFRTASKIESSTVVSKFFFLTLDLPPAPLFRHVGVGALYWLLSGVCALLFRHVGVGALCWPVSGICALLFRQARRCWRAVLAVGWCFVVGTATFAMLVGRWLGRGAEGKEAGEYLLK